jgi:hypothetical protein
LFTTTLWVEGAIKTVDTALSECHVETNKIHIVGLQFSLNSAICSLVSIIIVVSVV